MSSESSYSLLPIEQSYGTFVYVLVPISILYAGIYVTLRNHYIFKPKIETFLNRTKITSIVLRQLIIDFLCNLSITTFLISSILLTYSDKCLQLMVHNDLYWIGLCVAILSYRNIKQQESLEMKVVIKNGIFLCLSYIIILYQYLSSQSMLIMGLALMGIYLFNLILNANQGKFVKFIEQLFNNKPSVIEAEQYIHNNLMDSPEYLAANYPVKKQQIQEKLKAYQPSLKKIKLKTKVAVTRKLLMLSLAVRLSQQKRAQKMKQDVCVYYGGLNGTSNEKVKRLESENKPLLFSEENTKEMTSTEEQKAINLIQADDQLDFLFTIFPVKVFQSSKIVSILFTVFINLGFGVFLDYCMNITQTLTYGKFFNNLYALLLLPILPNISKTQYFNSMCLSSLWKYFLAGFFFVMYQVSDGDISKYKISNILQFQTIGIILLIIIVMIHLLSESKNQYKLPLVFFLLFCGNFGVTYYGARNG